VLESVSSTLVFATLFGLGGYATINVGCGEYKNCFVQNTSP